MATAPLPTDPTLDEIREALAPIVQRAPGKRGVQFGDAGTAVFEPPLRVGEARIVDEVGAFDDRADLGPEPFRLQAHQV